MLFTLSSGVFWKIVVNMRFDAFRYPRWVESHNDYLCLVEVYNSGRVVSVLVGGSLRHLKTHVMDYTLGDKDDENIMDILAIKLDLNLEIDKKKQY